MGTKYGKILFQSVSIWSKNQIYRTLGIKTKILIRNYVITPFMQNEIFMCSKKKVFQKKSVPKKKEIFIKYLLNKISSLKK